MTLSDFLISADLPVRFTLDESFWADFDSETGVASLGFNALVAELGDRYVFNPDPVVGGFLIDLPV